MPRSMVDLCIAFSVALPVLCCIQAVSAVPYAKSAEVSGHASQDHIINGSGANSAQRYNDGTVMNTQIPNPQLPPIDPFKPPTSGGSGGGGGGGGANKAATTAANCGGSGAREAEGSAQNLTARLAIASNGCRACSSTRRNGVSHAPRRALCRRAFALALALALEFPFAFALASGS
mmetsp:Transcript_1885/g.4996  ORF Transcript_1885/g.4996 Transcript_1885/m.4996 type:complete len:176 (+) Transcript_1885:204-731(+)